MRTILAIALTLLPLTAFAQTFEGNISARPATNGHAVTQPASQR